MSLADRAMAHQNPKDAIEHGRSFARRTPRGLFGSIGLMAVHSQSLSS
jgi:hypothetical protein